MTGMNPMTGITASVLTFAGCDYDKKPDNGPLARAMMAQEAGFCGIGISLAEEPDSAVLEYGFVPELEWVDLGSEVTDEICERVVKFARILGCTRLHCGVCTTEHVPWKTLVARLHRLAETGLDIALEPVAFGALSGVYNVQCIVGIVDDPKVGWLYDLWHVWHENRAFTWVPPLMPEAIKAIQICGVPPRGKYRSHKSILAGSQNRPCIRESVYNVRNWLDFLRECNVHAPLAYENPVKGATLAEQENRAAADLRWLV
jgi:sugar phosphate isomerase/epimerase